MCLFSSFHTMVIFSLLRKIENLSEAIESVLEQRLQGVPEDLRPYAREVLRVSDLYRSAAKTQKLMLDQHTQGAKARRADALEAFHRAIAEVTKNTSSPDVCSIFTRLRDFTLQSDKHPPGLEVYEDSMARHAEEIPIACTKLQEEAEKREGGAYKVPWEIMYAATLAQNEQGTIQAEFNMGGTDGGTSDGCDKCETCGVVVQVGEGGEGDGVPRYRCLECAAAVMCKDCYGAAMELHTRVRVDRASLLPVAPHVASDHPLAEEKTVTYLARIRTKSSHLSQRIRCVFTEAFMNRPLFGVEAPPDDTIDSGRWRQQRDGLCYEWYTYGDVWTMVSSLGGILLTECCPLTQTSPLGLYLLSGPLFVTAQYTCIALQRPCVTLDADFPAADIIAALRLSGTQTVVVDPVTLQNLSTYGHLAETKVTKLLLVVQNPFYPYGPLPDEPPPDEVDGVPVVAVDVAGASQKIFAKTFQSFTPSPSYDEANPVVVTVMSSGTSGGAVKGVAVRTKTFIRSIDYVTKTPHIGLSLYSSAWLTDIYMTGLLILNGARIGFVAPSRRGDIWPVVRLVRPNGLLVFVPSYLEMIAAEHAAKMKEELSRRACATPTPQELAWAYASAAQHVYESLLGGRCEGVMAGGAKVSVDHLALLRESVDHVTVSESYGSTESGGVGSGKDDSIKADPGIHIKLIDLPHLGYTTADTPYPRGEIAVKSPQAAAQEDWLCDDETKSAIAARYTEDGYIRTGDVGMLLPDGGFRVIDRVSAMLKLPSGRFFSPEKVEAAIGGTNLVAVFEGEVVVISPDGTLQLSTVQSRCRAATIPTAEIPTFVLHDTSDWRANGCLTGSGKLKRGKVIENATARLQKALRAARSGVTASSVVSESAAFRPDTLVTELLRTVGIAAESLDHLSKPWAELGVDSIRCAKLASVVTRFLRRQWGCYAVEVRAKDVAKAATPRGLVEWMLQCKVVEDGAEDGMVRQPSVMEKTLSEDTTDPQPAQSPSLDNDETAEVPEGAFVHHVTAYENHLLGLLRDRVRSLPVSLAHPPGSLPFTVLLTGATGFLGRHILIALLRNPRVATVACVVRADSPEQAASRLVNASPESDFIQQNVQRRRIVALSGDCELRYFGMANPMTLMLSLGGFPRLIIHAAAVVKSRPQSRYSELRKANAESCVHVAEIAAGCGAAVYFVSTLSSKTNLAKDITEHNECPTYLADCPGAIKGLSAYALTKRLGEIALQYGAAKKHFKLCIGRPALLTWPHSGPLDVNKECWFVRLVDTVLSLRLAPNPQDVGHDQKVLFSAVDDCARRVVTGAIDLVDDKVSRAPLDYPYDIDGGFCVGAALAQVPGDVKWVPGYAFRAALRNVTPPPPFFPLIDLLQGGGPKGEGHNAPMELPVEIATPLKAYVSGISK